MPKVSVIIPTYNKANLLPFSIESVISQTYKDWELIIVDDASMDSTREVIKKYQEKDSRIVGLFLDKNSGTPAHPKNEGFKITKGKYIAYLDHDDEWLPEKLEKQIAILDSNPKIGIVSCEALLIDKIGNIIGKESINNIPDKGVLPSIFLHDYMFSNSSIILPRGVISSLGPRDEDPNIGLAEDREFELRIATSGYVFYVIHEPLFKYRIHEGNMSNSSIKNGLSYALAQMKYITTSEKYGIDSLLLKNILRRYLELSDIKNSKKYCRIILLKNHFDIKTIIVYLLLSFGSLGIEVIKFLISIHVGHAEKTKNSLLGTRQRR